MFASFSKSMQPVGQTIGKGWSQAQQLAKETMGSTQDVTELPLEYRDLEKKLDEVKILHDQLLKCSRNYTLPNYDYQPDLGDRATDLASMVSNNASSFVGRFSSAGSPVAVNPTTETPATFDHAFAKAAFAAASTLPSDEPFGTPFELIIAMALLKFGESHERVGQFHLVLKEQATLKFHNVLTDTTNLIFNCQKSRRNVVAVRLTYDSLRTQLKNTSVDRIESVRAEMEKSEDEFVGAVDECMGLMKVHSYGFTLDNCWRWM